MPPSTYQRSKTSPVLDFSGPVLEPIIEVGWVVRRPFSVLVVHAFVRRARTRLPHLAADRTTE